MSPSPPESFDHEKELAAVGVQEAKDINRLNLDDKELKELDVSNNWYLGMLWRGLTCLSLCAEQVAGKFLAEVAMQPDGAQLLAPHTEKEERMMLRGKIDPIIITL